MNNRVDHFAIGAASLAQGIDALHARTGVSLPQGGKHPAMSTHNCVARAGNGAFVELVAIDPDAPPPGRTRWFTLDDPGTQVRLAVRPRALCWVVNTDDLDQVIANSPVDLGEVLGLSRGDLSWRLTVPADGSLAGDGLLPAFIEWSPGPHPSTRMQEVGLELVAVKLAHPRPDELRATLAVLGVDHLASVSEGPKPALSFSVRAPSGEVVELD